MRQPRVPSRPTAVGFGAAILVLGFLAGTQWNWRAGQSAFAQPAAPANFNKLYDDLRAMQSPLHSMSEYLAKVSQVTTPPVVHIQSERKTKRGLIEETGSGVVVLSEHVPGYFVVTNRHVVDGTDLKDIAVHVHDGRVLHPTRMWTDKATDLAVLKVAAGDLQPGRWGDSSKLDIGNVVLAMGSPFGLSQSVTFGIISAKGRRSLDLGSGSEVINQDFLQTDAAINPGNSGGPLINLQGEVVGINTAIASNSGGNEGIGFSIPSNLAHSVVEQLLRYGKVTRAYLGVKLDPDFDANTAARLKLDRIRGARILEVYKDTPASRAKLAFDDVILMIDGQEVLDETHLINTISLKPINERVKLVVLRDGKRITIEVILKDRSELDQRSEAPTQPGLGVPFQQLGLTLHPLQPDVARQLGYPQDSTGLLVLKVDPRGPAAGEVQLYDLVEEVARIPVQSLDDLKDLLQESPQERLLLKVQRNVRGNLHHHVIVLGR